MITPNDVAKVLEAAEAVEAKLTPAEATGWLIMDRLDPETRAALMARIDGDSV